MVTRELFERIRHKHGGYASWAVWADATGGAKSNIGDLAALGPDRNPHLLATLRPDVVMLGLNLSRFHPAPLANFHDPSPQGQDYKIRYAFAGSPYYGAYMTDLIKGLVVLDSKDLVRQLAADPDLVQANIRRLLEELDDLCVLSPTVIAFGRETLRLAAKYVPAPRYSRLVGVMHYSHYVSPTVYRARALDALRPRARGQSP